MGESPVEADLISIANLAINLNLNLKIGIPNRPPDEKDAKLTTLKS